MTRRFQLVLVALMVAWAWPAGAQSTASESTLGPTVDKWYIGVTGGPTVVEKVSGAASAEAGLRIWRNLDAVGELQWAGNVATGRQAGKMDTLADALGRTQGLPASGSIEVPLFYGGLGARWVLEQSGRYRPYFIATVGGARLERKPTLTLDGGDVTGNAAQYGVTLGQDVVGKYSKAATSAGLGLVMVYGDWYFDVGARLLSVNGQGQRTNAPRLVFGGGRRY